VPPPWTEDTILQTGSFCNARRADDSVSRWLTAWYAPHLADPDCWFAAVVARVASNEPSALGAITFPVPWGKERFKRELRAHALKGGKVERAAYTITVAHNFRALDIVELDQSIGEVLTGHRKPGSRLGQRAGIEA
jgi:hypothetical protein